MLLFYISRKFRIILRISFLNKYFSRIGNDNSIFYIKGYEKTKKEFGLDFLTQINKVLYKWYVRNNTNQEEFLDKNNLNLKYYLRQFVLSSI